MKINVQGLESQRPQHYIQPSQIGFSSNKKPCNSDTILTNKVKNVNGKEPSSLTKQTQEIQSSIIPLELQSQALAAKKSNVNHANFITGQDYQEVQREEELKYMLEKQIKDSQAVGLEMNIPRVQMHVVNNHQQSDF